MIDISLIAGENGGVRQAHMKQVKLRPRSADGKRDRSNERPAIIGRNFPGQEFRAMQIANRLQVNVHN
jgi:hypothetical protein